MIDLDYLKKVAISEQADPPAFVELIDVYRALTTPRPLSEYHEDMGPVLWWCWEILECGRCNDKGTVYDNVRAETFACPECHGKKSDEGRWLGEAPYAGSPLDLGHTVFIETVAYINQSPVKLKDGTRTRRQFIDVGGWPGYHTHWTPLPKVNTP